MAEGYFDVYISYKLADSSEEASILAHLLERSNIKVWIDKWKIQPWDNWKEKSKSALKNTGIVLVLVGPDGIGKSGQTTELKNIQAVPSLKVIPVLLPGANPDQLPAFLFNKQLIDLRTGLDYQSIVDFIKINVRLAQSLDEETPTKYTMDKVVGNGKTVSFTEVQDPIRGKKSSMVKAKDVPGIRDLMNRLMKNAESAIINETKVKENYQIISYYDITPAVASTAFKMPVDILLALPDGFDHMDGFFNLFGAIDQGLGQSSWETALQIYKPAIWAPDIQNDELLEVMNDRSRTERGSVHTEFTTEYIEKARLPEFPTLSNLRKLKTKGFTQFEIIHLYGLERQRNIELSHFSEEKDNQLIQVFNKLGTRLLILQIEKIEHSTLNAANKFASAIVRGKGPAVLVVAGNARELGNYFMGVYGNILHNLPVSQIANVETNENFLAVLHCGKGGENLLNFTRWVNTVKRTVQARKAIVVQKAQTFKTVQSRLPEMVRTLHHSQINTLKRKINPVSNNQLAQQLVNVAFPGGKMRKAGNIKLGFGPTGSITFGGVSIGTVNVGNFMPGVNDGGVVGLSKGAGHTPDEYPPGDPEEKPSSVRVPVWLAGLEEEHIFFKAQKLRDQEQALENIASIFNSIPDISELEESQKNAPRVLNANFEVSPGHNLEVDGKLLAGKEYPLLVDIGPKWSQHISLVDGNSVFPEEALQREQKYYLVDIVFVSDDFTPNISKAQMWLPARSGRSFPCINGKRAKKSGSVRLILRTPKIPRYQQNQVKVAHGRLCLYHQNNMLQSAIVKIGVEARPGLDWDSNNIIYVDTALTGSFLEVDKQIGKRKVTIGSGDNKINATVSVNLTLNDDGADGHRIITKYRVDADKKAVDYPPAFKHYDPEVGKKALDEFREELSISIPDPSPGDYKNLRDKLKADLTALAKIGSKLQRTIFSGLVMEKPNPDWASDLLYKALAKATVIQISRTAPAEYAFPWALIYDIPVHPNFPIDKYKCCDILEKEWDENAQRKGPPGPACPYQDEPKHSQDNYICPYSFWGYKHVIEQPLSIWNSDKEKFNVPPADKILVGPDLVLGVGVTRDEAIDQERLNKHLDELRQLTKVRFNPDPPADDQLKVREMLIAPHIVYFMCHGEGEDGQTYISIGKHDGDPMHKITSDDLGMWYISRQKPLLDRNAWERHRPLVFINGCHTTDIRPGLAQSLVSSFSEYNAGAVIGTEVSISTRAAYPAAQFILRQLVDGKELGQTIREMRWILLNRGDLSGLAYTPYSLANLKLVFEN